VDCDKTEKDLSRFLHHTKDHLVWEEEWLVGATPFTGNFGSSWPRFPRHYSYRWCGSRRSMYSKYRQ